MIAWTLTVGLVKGLVFGIRPYEFLGEELHEIDHVLYLGIFHITYTTIYER